MTRGEMNLRAALWEALQDAEHLDEADSIIDAVIPVLAAGEYFVHMGKILSVIEADWTDESYGEWSNYDLYVEDEAAG